MNMHANPSANEKMMRQLRTTFASLPNDITVYHFVDKAKDDIFAQANRQIIRAFRDLTDKITFREFNLDHELAKTHRVDRSPTLVFAPERYRIKWLGAPMGEEGRTLLETLILIGLGNSRMSEEAAKVVRNIDSPREVKVFVSATCPYCPQEAVNGVRAAIENPQMVSLELIDIQCNVDLAEKYSAMSVPQSYANDVLIGQGARAEEIFMSSLAKLEPVTLFIPESDAELVETDLVIVGGGPAGLTAGIYAERSGLKAAVIEKGALGGQVSTTPVVENYPGFTQIGGKTLVDIMVSHALQYVPIFQGEEVIDILPGNPMVVLTSRRKFHSRAVLLATGAMHRSLNVSGEQAFGGKGVSYCSTCDGPLFRGKKVAMIGGGNSAVTEALHLQHMGVDVTLVHRGDKLRAQDFLVKNLFDNGIPVLWNTEVQEIRGDKRVESVALINRETGKQTELGVEGVFIAIGYEPAVQLARKLGIDLTPEGFIKHDGNHRTNVPGIYSAGDVEGGYKQIVTATGQGSSAALAIFEDLINPYWLKEKRP